MTSASAPAPVLPGSLKTNSKLGHWLRVDRNGFVEVSPGKVEIGQGILTALAQIAADELDVSLAQVRLRPASTAHSPNEGVTSGSLSIQDSGSAIRHVCAETRAIYLSIAAERLGVSANELVIADGAILGPNNLSTSYWELADEALLERDATPGVKAKPIAARRLAGASTQRLDIPAKIFGEPRFIQDVFQNGVLHGRVLRPDGPHAKLHSIDERRTRAISGIVEVVRDGNFVGVVATSETSALAGLSQLRKDCVWQSADSLPDIHALKDWLRHSPCETTVVNELQGETSAAATRKTTLEFTRPFTAHASIGTVTSVAQWQDGHLLVWSHSQGVYNLRSDLALIFAVAEDRIIVEHAEGAGCYGHNGADDVALDAALLARACPGQKVRVVWSREEELGWAPFSPAMLVSIEAHTDAAGNIVAWNHDLWSNGHATRPGRAKSPTLLAGHHIDNAFPMLAAGNMPLATGGGADRNAVPGYAFPSQRITNHRLLDMPIRTSALRSLGAAANVFAIESMMDELAHAAGLDPVEYRLRHLQDQRARAVIEAAAARADWPNRSKSEGVGYGVGYAKYKNLGAWCAVIAEVDVGKDIRVSRLTIAVDAGEVINPDGLINQIEGGAIQAVSWALKEQVQFDRERITSDTWETYPILRFTEVPAVDVAIVSRPSERALGAGECSQGPTIAAIANAIRDALGVRVVDLPLTFDRIAAALNAD
jgi:nicotinate dehydrogenase subunit B